MLVIEDEQNLRLFLRQSLAKHGYDAEDYLTKPFGIAELMARVRVALRHARRADVAPDTIARAGEITLDRERRLVFRRDEEIHLTPTQYRLLDFMMRNAGKVLTHRQILKEVWAPA